MDDLGAYVSDDEHVYEPLRRRGWRVQPVSWRRTDVDWSAFEAVVIRTTWDYHWHPQAFLAVLEQIDHSAARLENHLDLVRWNMDKMYLRNLEAQGLPIVPTAWGRGLCAGRLPALFDKMDVRDMVVKPTIGAGADDTFRLAPDADEATLEAVEAAFRDRAYMAQPFVRSVTEEGEFSLFFFGGAYSHTILKTPKPRDFRVQEEHGGIIRAAAAEPALRALAEEVMDVLAPRPLQARVDLVRMDKARFAVMELELIEPSLYFRMDAAAPDRFARALDAWMER